MSDEYTRQRAEIGRAARELLDVYERVGAMDQSDWPPAVKNLANGLTPRDFETLRELATWADLEPED